MARLLTIGDSLSQGFQHAAIRRAAWSYPAMTARVLGAAFAQADFDAAGKGGPVLDLEQLLRRLSDVAGERLDIWDVFGVASETLSFMRAVEDYWERGPGTNPSGSVTLHHNLSVWGFEVLDASTLSDGICIRNMPLPKVDFAQSPELGMYRTARRVLNPLQRPELEELTQLQLLQLHAQHEPIENLIIELGANNVLGTCARLELRWSMSADFRKLAHQRQATIWEPEHFIHAYERIVAGVEAAAPRRVFLTTVPHVTIAPLTRGVSVRRHENGGGAQDERGYYEFYTRFWIWDDSFDPDRDPCFRREDARTIDDVIDEYNDYIRQLATRKGWYVIDLCGLLDQLAFRRRRGIVNQQLFPPGLRRALSANPNTAFRVRPDGTLLLDTRFFRIPKNPPPASAPSAEWQHAYCGGLFGLDGAHPTTVGYGLLADLALRAMRDAGVPDADPEALPWDQIVSADTLLTRTPALLASLQQTVDRLFSKARLDRVIGQLSGFGSQPL